ncbi:MAG TPA: malto-oligosyltrehalose synthase [Burkholderiales bacterium]|nr:malto-oligosyltrehalose synthase [Burkholderiales bacterium]
MSEVAESYLDVWGKEKSIPQATRDLLQKALGRERKAAKFEVQAGRCYEPDLIAQGGRVWGFMVQLYGVRSKRNWGIGDFGDLRRLVEFAASRGAGVVGVNPLHATQGSPYSPSSRHALNVLYLDIEAIPEFAKSSAAQKLVRSAAFQRQLEKLRSAELVDYAGVTKAKLQVLELLFKETRRRPKPTPFSIFEALRERFGGGWENWPEEYRDPASQAVKSFARKNAHRVAYYEYLQLAARTQLEGVQRRAQELGMPIGLYVDLALGADRGGAEVWADQDAFALDVTCGAPPDEFNPKGQDWGLPPYSPRALRESGYRPFAELLRANMPQGGALRMDHVMALSRLYWIPRSAKADAGGYVHYPVDELLAVLAAESRARKCLVIGEDLGTVSADLRTKLSHGGLLSYRPLFFERQGDDIAPPQAFPRDALVCVSTHDLPTWKGYWAMHDLGWRDKVGLTVDTEKERGMRRADQERVARALEREGLDRSARSAHYYIARTPCKVALVQPEDMLEEIEQPNLPGTVDQHPNWRRKLPLALESWANDPRVAATVEAMAERSSVSKMSSPRPLRVPDATYRFQFHKGFRFADAIKLVPYLARLGVSHLYASPFLKARPGSTHGYDVIDHNAVNPEIGTEKELHQLMDALKAHAMGLVPDLVPNHMGVLHADNAWWLDVLEKGKSSEYARVFDIDWNRGKLLLPVLGKHYGEALADGELKLEQKGGRWSVRYFDHRFPLNARSTRLLKLKRPKDSLDLHKVLEQQYYRLAYWRVASDEINYRRFFEITDLAGVRQEDRTVFEATHALIRRLAKNGGVDGLRIDHPDGLADPQQYLGQLQESFSRPWVVVEKILAEHEAMPSAWPVHGETGYRFVNLLTGVFIDPQAESRFDRIYQRFTGERQGFAEMSIQSRHLIMATTLAAELLMLSTWLARIAAGNRLTRDFTQSGLSKALADIAARFPVYRSYVSPRGVSDSDRHWIDWAVKAAKRGSLIADPSVFDFIHGVLTLSAAPPKGPRREEMLRFSMRFQQFTAPVVAKGVEDTAFYRFNRLIALNEVGGHPAHFGLSLRAFHAAAEDRVKRWPTTLLGSSTHDTKRSEDVRARLGVLSELPSMWRMALRRWSLVNRSHRTDEMPSRADEYHFYQALVGVWPADADRLKAYMLKSAREAKVRTSWINPDEEYEAALERFVTESMASPLFRKELDELVPRLAHLGYLVSLSQALVKVASPGVPDYYQGTELWDFSLVDPDNRRPVEFGVRASILAELEKHPPSAAELLAKIGDGKAKMHVIRQGLAVRKAHPELFHGGEYRAIHADAGYEENVLAFSLGGRIVAVAPRLFAQKLREEAAPIGERFWAESRLVLPNGTFTDVMTGREHNGGSVRMSELLGEFPVALLVRR